jgi:hypothetical protein
MLLWTFNRKKKKKKNLTCQINFVIQCHYSIKSLEFFLSLFQEVSLCGIFIKFKNLMYDIILLEFDTPKL